MLKPLTSVCNVYQPQTIAKKSLPKNGEYPVYGANGIIGYSDKYNHEEAQLLLGCRGSVGSVHVSEPFSWINGNAMVVVPNEEIISKDFLRFALLGGIKISDAISGTAQPQITKESLSKVQIPIFTLDRQREVVEKLEKAFTEIDELEKRLDLSEERTDQLWQSILSYIFTFRDANEAEIVPSGSQEFGVNIVPLREIVDVLDNKRIPINSAERARRGGNIPYYGATGQVGTIDQAIFDETLILLGEDGVPFFDPTKHKAYEISGKSWVNNHAHVLRAKKEYVIQRYLLHFLNKFNYTGYVNGSTRLKLTQSDMNRIPVPLPSIERQRELSLIHI